MVHSGEFVKGDEGDEGSNGSKIEWYIAGNSSKATRETKKDIVRDAVVLLT